MVNLVAVSSWWKYSKRLEELRTNCDGLHAIGKYLGLSFNDAGSFRVLQNKM